MLVNSRDCRDRARCASRKFARGAAAPDWPLWTRVVLANAAESLRCARSDGGDVQRVVRVARERTGGGGREGR